MVVNSSSVEKSDVNEKLIEDNESLQDSQSMIAELLESRVQAKHDAAEEAKSGPDAATKAKRAHGKWKSLTD